MPSLYEKMMLAAFPLPRPSRPPFLYRIHQAIHGRLAQIRNAFWCNEPQPPTARSHSDRKRYWQTRTAAESYFKDPSRRWLLDIAAKSSSTGADLTDYYLLHRYVISRRPARILELGSGVTTLFLAHALHELKQLDPGTERHLWSMEDVPSWHENARELCPAALRTHVTYMLSPKEETYWHGYVWSFCYKTLPRGEFDFVFVDGPTAKRGNFVGANGDIFRLLEVTDREFDAIVDFRWVTCTSLSRFLPPDCIGFDYALGVGVLRYLRKGVLREAPSLPHRLQAIDAFAWYGL